MSFSRVTILQFLKIQIKNRKIKKPAGIRADLDFKGKGGLNAGLLRPVFGKECKNIANKDQKV